MISAERSAELAQAWATPSASEPYAEVDIGPNRVALLKDGQQTYPAMLEAIAHARSTICLETYIFRDDRVGQRFVDALCERAKAGVEVLFMYDAWGSSVSLPTEERLFEAGVRAVAFGRWRFTGRAFARFFRRNHRKALIVDGLVGFLGGLNISDDYAAVSEGGSGWRDTHMRVVGPAARELEALFLKTWRQAKGARFYEARRFQRPGFAACAKLEIVGNEFSLDAKHIRRAYMAALKKAQRRLFITQAYFLPTARVLRAITVAARRGVRVAIILAGDTDVPVVRYAARALYPRLLRAGVELYEWHGRILHAKTAVADGEWATVGSSNLDPLSLRVNLEVNAVVRDRAFAEALERLFEEDLRECTRVTEETVRSYSLVQRLLSMIAFELRRWL